MTVLMRIAAIAVAWGMIASAAPSAVAADGGPAATPRPPSIYVVTAKKQPITDTVLASGTIRPVEEVYVQPQVDGLAVDTSDVQVGDRVEKGHVMAVLADDSLKLQLSQLQAAKAKSEAALAQGKAQLAEAKANADEAVRVRDRYKALSTSGTMSTANFDQASASADAALARVNSAEQAIAVARADVGVADAQIGDIRLRLARTKVRAPVSGVVSAKNLKVGAIASASGSPMFTIIKDDRLELRADVSEEDLLKVQPGQKVAVRLAGQSTALAARVRIVDPTVDLTSRLGTVRISFDKPDRIRAGMFANAAITVETKDAVVVPISAVGMSAEGSSVLKVSDGRVRATSVQTGIIADGEIEIVSGLAPGDEVVAKAGAFVRDGDRISPIPLEGARAAGAGDSFAAAIDNQGAR